MVHITTNHGLLVSPMNERNFPITILVYRINLRIEIKLFLSFQLSLCHQKYKQDSVHGLA